MARYSVRNIVHCFQNYGLLQAMARLLFPKLWLFTGDDPVSAPTIPDEDFFSLLCRIQVCSNNIAEENLGLLDPDDTVHCTVYSVQCTVNRTGTVFVTIPRLDTFSKAHIFF